MDLFNDRITLDPAVCNGKPTIRGLRITVENILGLLSSGETEDSVLKQYPDLEQQDILACLKFASDLMKRQYIIKDVA